MNRRTLVYITIAVAVVVVIVAFGLASRVPQTASQAPALAQLNVGDAAPEFQAATTQGPFDLHQSLGRPVFLEVFATWCPHCQHEVPIVNDLYAKYNNRVAFIAVNGSPKAIDETSPETQLDVYDFTQRFKVRYPVAFDPDLTVAKLYLQGGYPTIVIITKDGKIADVMSGDQTEQTLRADLDAVLR